MDDLDAKLDLLIEHARAADGPTDAEEQGVRARLAITLASAPGGSGIEDSVTASEAGQGLEGGAGVHGSGWAQWIGHGTAKWLGIVGLVAGIGAGVATWGGQEGARPRAPTSVRSQPGAARVAPEGSSSTAPKNVERAQDQASPKPAAQVKTSVGRERVKARKVSEPSRETPVRRQRLRQRKASKRAVEEPRRPQPAPLVPDELGLVRQATRALRDEHPAQALALLAEHARHHPDGMLRQERRGLRAIALCAAGRHEEGAAARDRFLRAAPRSPLAGRVRAACRTLDRGGDP